MSEYCSQRLENDHLLCAPSQCERLLRVLSLVLTLFLSHLVNVCKNYFFHRLLSISIVASVCRDVWSLGRNWMVPLVFEQMTFESVFKSWS